MIIISHHHSKLIYHCSEHIMHINSFNSHTYSTREVVLLLSSLRELRQKRAGHVPKVTERAGGGASTATHPRVNVPHHSNPLNCPKCSAERHYSPQSYCHFHSSITTTLPAGCPGHLVDGCIPSVYYYPVWRNN